MLCPYCGGEMRQGVIQCRDGVYWCEKPRAVAALPLGGGKTIPLGTADVGPFKGSEAVAYCCEKCRKIVVDYSEKE